MSYFRQIKTVTLWEFQRFFKPKNELKGIVIMLLVSVIFFFAGKYVLNDRLPEIEIAVINDTDKALTALLHKDFKIHHIKPNAKDSVLNELKNNKKLVLIDHYNKQFNLFAYKSSSDVNALKTYLDSYSSKQEMQKLGINEKQLASIMSPASISETYVVQANSGKRVILAYFFAGLMVLTVFLCFSYQFIAITGEKQLKITEQIVSAISPQTWMDGKILGITLTGLSSMFTYSVMSVIGGMIFFQFTGTPVSSILDYLYLPSIVLYLPFALIGVLIWNALLAGVASIITDPNNSGKSALMLLPVAFVVASFLVIRDPDSGLAVFLSWFPLTSATSMPMRWAITEVTFWQISGSFVLLILTFYVLRKIAAKIFRVSILMTGKEPSWKEVYQFLKLK